MRCSEVESEPQLLEYYRWLEPAQRDEIVNIKAEKATGENNLLIREAFHSHDMIPITSHGQPSVVPKAELNAHVASMATSSHKRAHASTIIRTPRKSRPLALVEPPTKDALRNGGCAVPTCQGLTRAARPRWCQTGAGIQGSRERP